MQTYNVTTATTSHSKDIDHRVKNYMISMIIRLVCLFGVFFFTGPLLWISVAGAVVIPYIAVIFANSQQGHNTKGITTVTTLPPRQKSIRS